MATWKKATHFLCHHAKLCQFLWVNAPWSPVFIWSTSKAHKIVLITISSSFILFRERISHFFILLSPDVYSSLYVPDLLLREDLLIYLLLWRRKWQPTPVLLPGKSHGRRSLVGCSPWGRWGLDMTERLLFSQNRNNSKEFIDKGRSAEIRTEIKLEVILIFPGRNQSTFIKIISPLTSLSHGINPWEGKSGG